MPIKNQEAIRKRAQRLENNALNGIDFILVSLIPNVHSSKALLEIHFFNNNHITDLADANFKNVFIISGGYRFIAGSAIGQIKVTAVESLQNAPNSLMLTVEPIGDYSTYTLTINHDFIDPLFNEIDFKFRPGCFNIDCSPEWVTAKKPEVEPSIDYFAKDFDSFKHTLINAMSQRIPGWQPTSEANFDIVLLELISASADELSDYQDRVMNEAYIDTAKKRVSIARLARLMDYHIYQGNQSDTKLAIEIGEKYEDVKLKLGKEDGFEVYSEGQNIQKFLTKEKVQEERESSGFILTNEIKDEQLLLKSLNNISLYTWDDSITTLSAGDVSADLFFENSIDAKSAICNINDGIIKYLLIQEILNPQTGNETDYNPNHRQILKLLRDEDHKAILVKDPLNTDANIVRVFWDETDKLKFNYCFTIEDYNGKKVSNITLFYGNIVTIFHGTLIKITFKSPKYPPPNHLPLNSNFSYFEDLVQGIFICSLPEDLPIAYLNTSIGGSDVPSQSTLQVTVNGEYWQEAPDLVHSSENHNHFVLETDENNQSILRFGDGINGKRIQDTDEIVCYYQIGKGTDGNIGSDTLIDFDKKKFPFIKKCWNPFNVTNGRDAEPIEEIIRKVPEAYKIKQLRAVTLKDYEQIVEKIPGVSKAAAKYMWTGSWRTVQIAVDPIGKTTLDRNLVNRIAASLDATKLIGEDYEIRLPEYVPLEIHVSFCVHSDYWTEDVLKVVEAEFSDGYTHDGKVAFFNPDIWTFGQELRASQIIGRIQSVQGVDYVIDIQMNRWNQPTSGIPGIIKIRPNEVIKVKNNPSHMEEGFIDFKAKGGRQ